MRRSVMSGVALAGIAAMTVATAGCGSSGGTGNGDKTLTVWLMNGSAPTSLTSQLNKQFETRHAGWKVNYQVQQWDGIGDKLGKALSSSNPPDVLELGNTQAVQYAKAGTLADLTSHGGELGESSWSPAMKKSGQWNGKQFAIPFYAANRVVIYRKDMFTRAGISSPPRSDAEWLADLKKLNTTFSSDPRFQSLYLPGQEWYTLMSFIWDHGGTAAKKAGSSWKGTLDSPQAKAGISFYKQLVETSKTKAPKDTDEAKPQQSTVFAQDGGHVAMMIGVPSELKTAIKATPSLAKSTGAFPIPSHTPGKTAPVFLGGSDLAIAAASTHQKAALDYLKLLTSKKYQTLLAKNGSIPGLTSDTGPLEQSEVGNAMVTAAANGKVTPITPNWAPVEAQNPMKTMLTEVLTGTKSLDTAAKAASRQITTKMSGS